MSGFSLATLYLPEWAIPWVAVFGIAAWIVGARALAVASAIVLLAELFLAPLLAPWLATMPLWGLVMLLVVLGLTVEFDVITVIFDRDVARRVIAGQVGAILKFGLLSPFRLLGFVVKRLAR